MTKTIPASVRWGGGVHDMYNDYRIEEIHRVQENIMQWQQGTTIVVSSEGNIHYCIWLQNALVYCDEN